MRPAFATPLSRGSWMAAGTLGGATLLGGIGIPTWLATGDFGLVLGMGASGAVAGAAIVGLVIGALRIRGHAEKNLAELAYQAAGTSFRWEAPGIPVLAIDVRQAGLPRVQQLLTLAGRA